MLNNKPHKDFKGRFIHFCMADGCRAWGSFGFPGGLWLCIAHKGIWEQTQAQLAAMAAQPVDEEQGKLL